MKDHRQKQRNRKGRAHRKEEQERLPKQAAKYKTVGRRKVGLSKER